MNAIRSRLAGLTSLLLVAAITGAAPAAAQDFSAMPKVDGPASPFAFAQSGEKAKQIAAPKDESGSRVLGGEPAAPGAWPWQVALLMSDQPVGPNAQFCGGSLVADRWVLTAAHCIYMDLDGDGVFTDLDPQAVRVLAGTNVIAPGNGELIEVERIVRHPDYNPNGFDNDIAMIRLVRHPSAGTSTILVPDSVTGDNIEVPGVRATVTGWGLTKDLARPAELLQADIEMLPRDACNQALMELRAQTAAQGFMLAVQAFGIPADQAQIVWSALVSAAKPPLTPNMVCSGTYSGGRGACNGDSGGPLVVQLSDGRYIQAGVVSWGLSDANTRACNTEAKFSAYTRVANYLQWMQAVATAQ